MINVRNPQTGKTWEVPMHALLASSPVLESFFKHESREKTSGTWNPEGEYDDKTVGHFIDLCVYPENGSKSLAQLANELDVSPKIADMLRFYDAQPLLNLCRDLVEFKSVGLPRVTIYSKEGNKSFERTARNIAELDNLSVGKLKWIDSTLAHLFDMLYPSAVVEVSNPPRAPANKFRGYNKEMFELLPKRIIIEVHDWKARGV